MCDKQLNCMMHGQQGLYTPGKYLNLQLFQTSKILGKGLGPRKPWKKPAICSCFKI